MSTRTGVAPRVRSAPLVPSDRGNRRRRRPCGAGRPRSFRAGPPPPGGCPVARGRSDAEPPGSRRSRVLVHRNRLGCDLAVDDDQFEDTVPVDVGRDRAGPEAVRLGGRSEVDATPARVVTALSDASEEPVLLSRGVEEQLLAAVVVEVGGHDGPDAPGVAGVRAVPRRRTRGARRRRRFDPSSLPTTNANRPPSSTGRPPRVAGRVRECRAAVGPVVVAAVVPKQPVRPALNAEQNRPRPNSAGPRAATDTPVDLQPDRVGHVRDLAVVADFVEGEGGRTRDGDAVAAGSEAVERRPTDPARARRADRRSHRVRTGRSSGTVQIRAGLKEVRVAAAVDAPWYSCGRTLPRSRQRRGRPRTRPSRVGFRRRRCRKPCRRSGRRRGRIADWAPRSPRRTRAGPPGRASPRRRSPEPGRRPRRGRTAP